MTGQMVMKEISRNILSVRLCAKKGIHKPAFVHSDRCQNAVYDTEEPLGLTWISYSTISASHKIIPAYSSSMDSTFLFGNSLISNFWTSTPGVQLSSKLPLTAYTVLLNGSFHVIYTHDPGIHQRPALHDHISLHISCVHHNKYYDAEYYAEEESINILVLAKKDMFFIIFLHAIM